MTILHALLIGIDCYMPGTVPGLPHYPHLSGCVGDVELMEEFLRNRLSGVDVRITKLTASGVGSRPSEPEDQWPTKANLVAVFQRLAQEAQAGDQVYIHYSGHGGRALTLYPQVKGQEGLDESLVPTDYGQIENPAAPEDRYLRDLELATLLQTLVERGAVITVVLDSCHAGGASRGGVDTAGRIGGSMAVRGSAEVDQLPRAHAGLVGPPAELAANWQAQSRGTRSVQVAAGWLPDPTGYTLLAACRALELASEDTMPDGKRHGFLTYWLWDALQKPMRSWAMVHQQVAARLKVANPSQRPQLQGVGDRAIFGGATVALPAGIDILEVEGDRLRLDSGRGAGVLPGAQFFIYPAGIANFKQTAARLAIIEVTESNDAHAWARVLRRLDDDPHDSPLETGSKALLFNPGSALQWPVYLIRDGATPADAEESALKALATTIEQSESRFVRLAAEGEREGFGVAVTEDGRYEIRDIEGNPLPHLYPVSSQHPQEAHHQLLHLARYYNILELDNPDPASPVAGALEAVLLESQERAFADPGGVPTVTSGEQVYYLRVRNLFPPVDGPPNDSSAYLEETRRRTLNLVVLNLAPDWSVTRVIPPPGDASEQIELGPGETLLLPRYDLPDQPMQLPAFLSALPPGADEADDILKLFATTEPTSSYNAMTLPALQAGSERDPVVSAPKPQPPEQSWLTAQVYVRVVR